MTIDKNDFSTNFAAFAAAKKAEAKRLSIQALLMDAGVDAPDAEAVAARLVAMSFSEVENLFTRVTTMRRD